MSKNSRMLKNAVETTEVVVPEVVVIETVETLAEKISRIKTEQATQLAELLAQKKALDDKVKELKVEEAAIKEAAKEAAAKERAEKLAGLVFKAKVNKTQVIFDLMLKGCSREQMATETGYTSKFIADTIWGLEKKYGLR